jgi:hypothetical protein
MCSIYSCVYLYARFLLCGHEYLIGAFPFKTQIFSGRIYLCMVCICYVSSGFPDYEFYFK